MPQIINTNVMSLNSQRNLNTSQTALQTSLQRLSSGLRINSAKDDAAGLAISERFTTQIRGLNQASRNANDGISLAQTAEGALAEINNNMQRIRELAVQSANATNSVSDRAALDQEVQQRLAEINRVSSQTSFNGQKILDGSFGNANFQVGANVGEIISLDLNSDMRTNKLGQVAAASSADLSAIYGNASGASGTFTSAVSDTAQTGAGEVFSLTVGGVEIMNQQQETTSGTSGNWTTATASADGTDPSVSVNITLKLGTDNLNIVDITKNGQGSTITAADIDAAVNANIDQIKEAGYTVKGTAGGDDLEFVRADGQAFNVAVSSTKDDGTGAPGTAGEFANFPGASETGAAITVAAADIDAALTSKAKALAAAGIKFSGTAADADLVFMRDDGKAFDIKLENTFSGTAGGFGGWTFNGGVLNVDNHETQTFGQGALSIAVGSGKAVNIVGEFDTLQDLADSINGSVAGLSAIVSDGKLLLSANESITLAGSATGADGKAEFNKLNYGVEGSLRETNITTVDDANKTIQRIDASLASISGLRSTFGAIQNRFESTIANLATTAENLTASRSRILDTDFAEETAALTRAQILQQAGVAMLAQANQLPQNVLSLLR